jgi:4'-phosphopantetheinyl transferase
VSAPAVRSCSTKTRKRSSRDVFQGRVCRAPGGLRSACAANRCLGSRAGNLSGQQVDGWPSIPILSPGECQVWWAAPALPHSALLACLDEGERDQWARFRIEAAKARYLAAHALLRILLSADLHQPANEIQIEQGPHGKPRVRGRHRLEFSITHSGEAVGVALSRSMPIGIDVEDLGHPVRELLWNGVLSEYERPGFEELTGGYRHVALTRCFTRKEALLKATGDGLTVPMRTLTVSAPGTAPHVVAWDGREELAHAARLVDLEPPAGYVGSLAILGDAGAVRGDLVVREQGGDALLHRVSHSMC